MKHCFRDIKTGKFTKLPKMVKTTCSVVFDGLNHFTVYAGTKCEVVAHSTDSYLVYAKPINKKIIARMPKKYKAIWTKLGGVPLYINKECEAVA